jgi:hypothetical protein
MAPELIDDVRASLADIKNKMEAHILYAANLQLVIGTVIVNARHGCTIEDLLKYLEGDAQKLMEYPKSNQT